MSRCLAIVCAYTCVFALACDKGETTVSPDSAPPEATEPQVAPEPEEASPALVAQYTGLVHEVYSRDASRCLEDQMEAEDSRYMRSAYTLTIGVALDGSTEHVKADEVHVQVLNYGGEVLKEGNAEAMGECLVEAASDWDFEPLPPSATSFQVKGRVGD